MLTLWKNMKDLAIQILMKTQKINLTNEKEVLTKQIHNLSGNGNSGNDKLTSLTFDSSSNTLSYTDENNTINEIDP